MQKAILALIRFEVGSSLCLSVDIHAGSRHRVMGMCVRTGVLCMSLSQSVLCIVQSLTGLAAITRTVHLLGIYSKFSSEEP